MQALYASAGCFKPVQFWLLANTSHFWQKSVRKGEKEMARVPQVTRTIQTTIATVLCLDLVKKEPFEKEVKLPRTFKDEKHMMKKIEAIVNNETVKAVHVIKTKIEETLYGMSEQKFIENADILPPRNENKE